MSTESPLRAEYRPARFRCYRIVLRLSPEEMAAALRVNPRQLKRWENGQDRIPPGVWDDIDVLLDGFEEPQLPSRLEREVYALLDSVVAQVDRFPVRVWRASRLEQQFPPDEWLLVVGTAMLEDPVIEPVYPEDEGDV